MPSLVLFKDFEISRVYAGGGNAGVNTVPVVDGWLYETSGN